MQLKQLTLFYTQARVPHTNPNTKLVEEAAEMVNAGKVQIFKWGFKDFCKTIVSGFESLINLTIGTVSAITCHSVYLFTLQLK